MRILSHRPGRARSRASRGAVSVLVAGAMIALTAFMGFGIDLGRMWLVQSRLQTSLDACALVAAREINLATRNADTAAMFWSNYAMSRSAAGAGYFGAVAGTPVVTQVDQSTVTVTAQATVRMVFASLFGVQNATVNASAQAIRATTGMELALVLDNTGSMAGAPMQAVIDASTELVNIVYGSGSQDVVPNLWVSVVPFTAEVNIGPAHIGWLAPGSYNPANWANGSWAGCVLARHVGGHDADDATPATAPFVPFLYASTKGLYYSGGKALAGDDDWSPTNITEASQSSLPANTAVGPDLGCDALSILPLTASRTSVLSVVSRQAATYRGGTFINLGLQAGWFTVSPKWRGLWGSSTLPLDYNTPNMAKVIVLMTDGNNDWYSWPGGAPDNQGDADYTSYGRLSTNALGLTASSATTYLNNSMLGMCTTIKANGIIIYTVLFNHSAVDTSTITLFQNCASSPQKFFLTPTEADLQAAFSTIGSQLASLRISQ